MRALALPGRPALRGCYPLWQRPAVSGSSLGPLRSLPAL